MRIGLIGLGLSFFVMGVVGVLLGSIILGGFGVVFLILAPIFVLIGLIMREVPEAFPSEPSPSEPQLEAPLVVPQEPVRERHAQIRTGTGEARSVRVSIDWDACMGAGSCVVVAPGVFQLDERADKSVFISRAPLRVRDTGSVDDETILTAAQSCPYNAIIVEDEKTGKRIHPR
jgi:ferredoxin